jgi:pimeloyl-ACP methyl ester carboxylesterase
MTRVVERASGRVKQGMVRAEYIEVERNVRLHITDAGEGRSIVLIHGWPLAVLVGFSMGGSIAIHFASMDKGAHVSKLVLCAAAAPVWTQRNDFQYNLPVSAVDELIELSYTDRPLLVSNFGKIFAATETALNEGIRNWLNGINLSASSYATTQCLIALRDTDLRGDLAGITIPTLIMHGKKDKICSFDLAEQMKTAIRHSHIVAFENSGHSLFLEETPRFNAELIKFSSI